MQTQLKKFQKRPLLFSLVFFAVVLTVYFFLHKLVVHKNIIAKQAQSAWQEEIDKRVELQSLERLLKATNMERSALDSHFIKSTDIVPFLDMLEKTADKLGAKAEVSGLETPKDNSSLIVAVRVDGRFEAIYKFLLLLESAPYELDIVALDMQKGADSVDEKGKTIPSAWAAVFKVKILSFIQ